MICNLYGIIDIKADALTCVFISPSPETAERSFIDLLSKVEEDVFNQHPEDFSLYDLAEVNLVDKSYSLTKRDPILVRAGSDFSKPYLEGLRLARQKFLEKLVTSQTIGGSDADE